MVEGAPSLDGIMVGDIISELFLCHQKVQRSMKREPNAPWRLAARPKAYQLRGHGGKSNHSMCCGKPMEKAMAD